jgi:hypothetical protein
MNHFHNMRSKELGNRDFFHFFVNSKFYVRKSVTLIFNPILDIMIVPNLPVKTQYFESAVYRKMFSPKVASHSQIIIRLLTI